MARTSQLLAAPLHTELVTIDHILWLNNKLPQVSMYNTTSPSLYTRLFKPSWTFYIPGTRILVKKSHMYTILAHIRLRLVYPASAYTIPLNPGPAGGYPPAGGKPGPPGGGG